MTEKEKEEALRRYFDEGGEIADIAGAFGMAEGEFLALLADERLIAPYRQRAEAAKLRAMIRVNESAEEAARRQAELLREEEASIRQRAAKDILDRADIGPKKDTERELVITFAGAPLVLGMPERAE